jgi:ABC-type multidrug transport system fused ATPase/permease subunit
VEFKNVTFAYAAALDKPALVDVSFKIPAGTVTAIVGGSGAGKTTLVSLLLRLYLLDVNQGSVCIDDVDVKDLNADWLRAQVSVSERLMVCDVCARLDTCHKIQCCSQRRFATILRTA